MDWLDYFGWSFVGMQIAMSIYMIYILYQGCKDSSNMMREGPPK